MRPDEIAALHERECMWIAAAQDRLPCNPDGSHGREDLYIAVGAMMPPEDSTARLRARGKIVVDRHTKPGANDAQGLLDYGGGAMEPWEPDRLVVDGNDNIIETRRATLEFLEAALAREEENADRVNARLRIRRIQVAEMKKWVLAESAKGRLMRELTFGVFVKETGILH